MKPLVPPTAPTGRGARTSPSRASAKRRHDLPAAFGYAFAGLWAAWRSEPNLRIHALLAALALIGAWLLRLPVLGWALVIFAIALVLSAELINSAVESVVDLVSPEEHPLAKRAKDVAAAGVLVAAAGALLVGVFVVLWAIGRI
jgi:diacylglycerol kinase